MSDPSGTVCINPNDGAKMIFIPAGEFLMGDDDREDNQRSTVMLPGYWIYKDLVTVGMYKKFCRATGNQMPPEPVYLGNHFNSNWASYRLNYILGVRIFDNGFRGVAEL